MKKKLISGILMVGLVTGVCPVWASNYDAPELPVVASTDRHFNGNNGEVRPLYRLVEDNSYSGSYFSLTQKLYHRDGTYVNFSVTNHASYPVRIAINNEAVKIVKPGATNHVSVSIGRMGKTCKFTAAPQGGNVNISYKIVQRP